MKWHFAVADSQLVFIEASLSHQAGRRFFYIAAYKLPLRTVSELHSQQKHPVHSVKWRLLKIKLATYDFLSGWSKQDAALGGHIFEMSL